MDGLTTLYALFVTLLKSKNIVKQKSFLKRERKEIPSTSSTESSGKMTFLPKVCAMHDGFLSSAHWAQEKRGTLRGASDSWASGV